jgi:hypothetical protein
LIATSTKSNDADESIEGNQGRSSSKKWELPKTPVEMRGVEVH